MNGGGIVAMLRHKGRWWDSGQVKDSGHVKAC